MYVTLGVGDVVWNGLIAALVTVTLAWIGKSSANKAADKAEQVKVDLKESNAQTDDKLNAIALVADKTHTLVNSNMGAQLRISAVALRRVADITKHPDDDAAANLAENVLKEHEAKQAVVDANEKGSL